MYRICHAVLSEIALVFLVIIVTFSNIIYGDYFILLLKH